MEIRLVNESAGVVGHVEIIENPNTGLWEMTPYFDNLGEATAVTAEYDSLSLAEREGMALVEQFKEEGEDAHRQRYNEEPKGVMGGTGFEIQIVED